MPHRYFSLSDKTALITGAGSGIGRAIAQVFAEAGARVWIADIQPEKGEEAARSIREKNQQAQSLPCDVTRMDSVRSAVDHILEEDGRIDILVNNAGIGFVGNLLQTPEEDFDRLMEVNVKGVFLVSKAVLPSMAERRQGVIINMASIASLIGVKDRFAYCATKGAVLMMTKSIALDFVDQGVRCNCICPTRIHTPFVDEYLEKNYPDAKEQMFSQLCAYQPLRRMGRPEEVAYLALYLASDEASFHTGDAFPIAGGKLMG
ncbi:MAG: SDR family oxidoreductase [Candidatus Omnitrophica bacterium]|nr:SDR family oxidoreductase [Candidatus Omnitrophota bacterium]